MVNKEQLNYLVKWVCRFREISLILNSDTIHSALSRIRLKRWYCLFYFSFNNKSKQDESSILRALLLQLSYQLCDGSIDLTQLHKRNTTGVSPFPVLLDYLRRLIKRFHRIYILLDALNKSSINRYREKVLNTLEAMRNWGL